MIKSKRLSAIIVILLSGLLSGCGDRPILMSDSEKANWQYFEGASNVEIQKSMVRSLSRDLETCRKRNVASSLTDVAMRSLSRRQYDEPALDDFAAPCTNTFRALIKEIDVANSMKIRADEIFNLLLEGQNLGTDSSCSNTTKCL